MEIEIIPIAKRKAGRRGIPEEWIRETVIEPEQVVEGHGEREVAQKIYNVGGKEYLLRVVFERGVTERIIVITAYLTSQVERYWEEEI